MQSPVRVINASNINNSNEILSIGITWVTNKEEEQDFWDYLDKVTKGEDAMNEFRQDVNLNIQYERLKNSRPYLPVDDYATYLESLRSKRDDLYRQVASFSLNSDDSYIDQHAEKIVDAFQKA